MKVLKHIHLRKLTHALILCASLICGCTSNETIKDSRPFYQKLKAYSTYDSLSLPSQQIIEMLSNSLMNDSIEGRIKSFFENIAKDTSMNQTITELNSLKLSEQSAMEMIFVDWDDNDDKNNRKHHLVGLLHIIIHCPDMSYENTMLLIHLLDKRYNNGIYSLSTQRSLLGAIRGFDRLSNGAQKAVIEAIRPCRGLLKDIHDINRFRKNIGLDKCL